MANLDFKARPSPADVKSKLTYNPVTGVVSRIRQRKDKVSGTVKSDGHMEISIFYRRHPVHRLAWVIATGEWPKGVIDHINGNPSDNRLCNLRDVSHAENIQNQRQANRANKSSGYLGVTSSRGRWEARIMTNGKNIYLGRFDTPEEAHQVYLAAKRNLHPGCVI